MEEKIKWPLEIPEVGKFASIESVEAFVLDMKENSRKKQLKYLVNAGLAACAFTGLGYLLDSESVMYVGTGMLTFTGAFYCYARKRIDYRVNYILNEINRRRELKNQYKKLQ